MSLNSGHVYITESQMCNYPNCRCSNEHNVSTGARASWLCSHDACGFNIVWGSDGINTSSEANKISVRVKMPGVNIIRREYIRSRPNLDTRSAACSLQVERRPPSVRSQALPPSCFSLSPPPFMRPYVYITALLFYWMLFQLWTVLRVLDDGHLSYSWERSFFCVCVHACPFAHLFVGSF